MQGLCSRPEFDQRLWFSANPKWIDRARTLCGRCPFLQECSDYVMSDRYILPPRHAGSFVVAGMTRKELVAAGKQEPKGEREPKRIRTREGRRVTETNRHGTEWVTVRE
jgi:hypothetical protein